MLQTAPRVVGITAVLVAVTGSSWIVPLLVTVVAAAQQPGRKLQRAALADAVVRDGAAVVQLLARVGQVLVANHLAVLVLHLAFDTADSVRRLRLDCDGLAADGADEKLKEESLFVD